MEFTISSGGSDTDILSVLFQFYISCAQVTVTGGSGGTPSPTTKIPGHVKATDPGYTVNVSIDATGITTGNTVLRSCPIANTSLQIYNNFSNYTVPGPAVVSSLNLLTISKSIVIADNVHRTDQVLSWIFASKRETSGILCCFLQGGAVARADWRRQLPCTTGPFSLGFRYITQMTDVFRQQIFPASGVI